MSLTLIPIYFYFIAVSFLVSLSLYSNSTPEYPSLKWWPPFLFLTLLVELAASFLYLDSKNNTFVYNFFILVEFTFYMINLSFFVRNPRAKKIIRLTIIPFTLFTVFNYLFLQGIMKFNSITYSVGSLFIVSFSIYYFFELFRSPKSVKLRTDPAFWICIGLLFFYVVLFPFYALANFSIQFPRFLMKNFQDIISILNCFLYTLYTIAFLCKRTRNYTQSSS
jgi:hypothetical protein